MTAQSIVFDLSEGNVVSCQYTGTFLAEIQNTLFNQYQNSKVQVDIRDNKMTLKPLCRKMWKAAKIPANYEKHNLDF